MIAAGLGEMRKLRRSVGCGARSTWPRSLILSMTAVVAAVEICSRAANSLGVMESKANQVLQGLEVGFVDVQVAAHRVFEGVVEHQHLVQQARGGVQCGAVVRETSNHLYLEGLIASLSRYIMG